MKQFAHHIKARQAGRQAVLPAVPAQPVGEMTPLPTPCTCTSDGMCVACWNASQRYLDHRKAKACAWQP